MLEKIQTLNASIINRLARDSTKEIAGHPASHVSGMGSNPERSGDGRELGGEL